MSGMDSRPVNFWRRISDGIAIQQLWAQFHADARSSYQFYSKDVDLTAREGESRWKRGWRIAQALFWAMMMKLSPGRRVLLLIALLLLVFPGIRYNTGDERFETFTGFQALAGVVLLVLLALELSDRVAMKRDLEIAREIQSWLMPTEPPSVPGVDIAFSTRPANTVAGDYYDAFFRSNGTPADGGCRRGRQKRSSGAVDCHAAGESAHAGCLAWLAYRVGLPRQPLLVRAKS